MQSGQKCQSHSHCLGLSVQAEVGSGGAFLPVHVKEEEVD